MPLVVQIVRSSSVAAPAGLVLLLLVLFWLIPYFIGRGSLPRQVVPLLGFVLVVLLSTILAAFLPIPPFKDNSNLVHSLQALMTLVIGVSFYLIATTIHDGSCKIEYTLRLINWSGSIVLLWSLLQTLVWLRLQDYPGWMNDIQGILSTADMYRYQQRATGFTAEPSWLAHQLNMLYLPLWLASTISRYSAHRFKVLRLTFENLLLAGGIVVLSLTLSRAGLVAFMLMLSYLAVKLHFWIKSWLQSRIASDLAADTGNILENRGNFLLSIGLMVFMLLIYLGIILAVVYGLSQVDPRMQNVFSYDVNRDNPLLRYGSELRVEARIVYWIAGWEIFNDHPWLGVGLGNSGFFFPQKITFIFENRILT